MNDPFEKQDNADAQSNREQQRRRAVEYVRRFMKKSDDYRRPFLSLANQAREQYRCWDAVAKSITQRANLKLPYAYLIVETEVPQLTEIFLKEESPFKFKGERASDMVFQDPMSDFFGNQLQDMKFPVKFISFTKGGLIDGTAVAKVPYKYKEALVAKRSIVTDVFGISYPSKSIDLEVLYDGPDFEPIKLDDFFPDWTSRVPGDIESMRGCVHRVYKNKHEIVTNAKRDLPDGRTVGMYENVKELDASLNAKGCAAWGDPYYKIDQGANNVSDADKNKPIEVWEYWGLFDPKGDGKYEEYVIAIANGDVVLRMDPNFYDYKLKPFVAFVNVPQDNEFYGVSELFAVRGLIKEATALRNARLDQVSLAVNRMYVVDRAGGVTANSLYARPNGIIWANDVNAVRELNPPEVPASSYREIQEISSEIQAVVGSSAGPGLTEAGRVFGRSATGASMVSNIAGSRIAAKARMMSEGMFKPFAKIMMMTNAQFVTEDQWVKVSDPNSPNPFVMLPQQAFHCNYAFDITTSLETDSAMEGQKLQQAVQFFQAAEQTQPGTIKWDVVFQAIGRNLLGKQVKNFVRSDAERQQLMAQGAAAEQMANAQIGATAPGTGEGY